MTATLHLGIRNAVADLLAAATALAGGRIHRNREFVLAQGEASAIWVNRGDSEPERRTVAGTMDWSTDISVQIRTRKDGATDAETAADSLSADVYARVMAATNLGGLAIDVIPGPITWDQDENEGLVCVCTLAFTALHRTTEQAITA
jgi:hypothetical protein